MFLKDRHGNYAIDSELRVERVRSKRQVCDLLGISPSTLTRLEASGEFPPRTQISERRYGWRDSRLQVQIRRAFIISGGQPLSTAELVRRCYPRSAQTGKLKRSHCVNVRRAAALVAVRVRYGRGHGPPILWKASPSQPPACRQVVGSQT